MGYMTRRGFGVAVVAALATANLGACSGSGGGAAQNGSHLGVSDFEALIAKPGTVVIDVRTPSEFAAGHLPYAVNIDVQGADFAQRVAALDKSGTYALYCHSGNRSGRALDQLTGAGFQHVVDLSGGVGAWTAAGHQLVTGS